jgi:putative transposase
MGGFAYHILNRAVGRGTLFEDDNDYAAFERVLEQAYKRSPMRILCYCLMPNHWHLVLWPRKDGELSEFMRWLTVTHTQRWHAHKHTAGTGPLYQGRFKSFPIQRDHHLLTVCRYVERNALRANLVKRAEYWPWCSLYRRRLRRKVAMVFLMPTVDWPVEPPRNWLSCVNRADNPKELEAIRLSVVRGAPYGNDRWQQRTATRLQLDSAMRPRGRPKGFSPKTNN